MTKSNFGKYLTPKTIINLSIILGFLVFIIPTLLSLGSEVQNRAEALRNQRASVTTRSESIARLAELKRSAEEASGALQVLSDLVPPRDELFSFPDYLSELGEKTRIETNFTFIGEQRAQDGGRVGSSSFRIDNVGSFNGILSFIQNLENGPKFIISLNSVDIVKTDSGFKSTAGGNVFFYE